MSNEYKDWMRDKIEDNKELCEKYPFLLPRNVFTDKLPEDYDYSYTWLDDMPDGWYKAFGLRMCEEIKQALQTTNYLEQYRIQQIKEKFGALRWYDNGHPESVGDIIWKYEYISEFICIKCGKTFPEAMMINGGWISPYCRECYQDDNEYERLCRKEGMKDRLVMSRFSKDKETEREIPIKNTWEAIVRDYKTRMGID